MEAQHAVSTEVLNLAQQVKRFVERLAGFFKQRKLKGVRRIFFEKGRLLLEFILCQCRINITYSLLNEGLNTQVVILTFTVGGAVGFTVSWFSTCAVLVILPVLISNLLI